MPYLTFGTIQRRATAAGLVMSRQGVTIHLRYRNASASARTWSNLDAQQASDIVTAIAQPDERSGADTGPLSSEEQACRGDQARMAG